MALADLIKKYLQKGDIELTVTREKMVEKLLNGKKPAEKSEVKMDGIAKLVHFYFFDLEWFGHRR